MACSISDLPYRPNVGAMLFNREGKLFLARRADMPGVGGPPSEGVWQCPQGGIDKGESPETAVMRELREEIGTDKATIIVRYPGWLSYDLPPHLLGRALGGKYRGQTQAWFALRFDGQDADINLTHDKHPEFDLWQWVNLEELTSYNVGFKKDIYSTLVAAFLPLVPRIRRS